MLKYNLQGFQKSKDYYGTNNLDRALIQARASSLPGTGLLISSADRQIEALSTEESRRCI
jgi:hypothetical protein